MAGKARRSIAELAARELELENELRELREEIAQRAGEEDNRLRQQLGRK